MADNFDNIPEAPATIVTRHFDGKAPAPRTSPDGLRTHMTLEEAKARAVTPVEPGPYRPGQG